MSLKLKNLKIKKGDPVVVISGKDKGKKGDIVKVLPKINKVVINGINIVKRHTKPSKINPQGGILSIEKPISISNIAYRDPKTDLPTKVGFMIKDDGQKIRYAKRSGEIINK